MKNTKYTKKQINEAIAYWKKQLNEQNRGNLLQAIETIKTQIKDIRSKYQGVEKDFNDKYSSDDGMKNKLYALYDSIEDLAYQFGLTF